MGSSLVILVLAFVSVRSGFGFGAAGGTAPRPSVVLILADDLGYSDLGCFGGEIETPRLDALAANGLRFTRFHNTGRCWPTRASLLTGYWAQEVRRDTVPGVRSGGSGERPTWAPLVAARLREVGYSTYHSGKWHLDAMPLACGFDRSYYLKDQGRYFAPRVHYEDDRPLDPVPPAAGYYATSAIADHAVAYLAAHAARSPDRPFFLYLAFTAPHFPLHAPAAGIARYRDRYRAGWDVVRARRSARLREEGIVVEPHAVVESEVGPPYDFPDAIARLGPGELNRPRPWSELDESQREFQATKMAIHAAMVDALDRAVGRVVDELRRSGALDDTLILFLSDNGASAEIMVRDDGHDPTAPPGSGSTYLCLGPGWSTVANTPFRRHKTWVHEGGIATPLIASWPRGIAARGAICRRLGHVVDVVPTLIELAGVDAGVTGAPPLRGRSLVPALNGDERESHEELWWCHEENRALRSGRFKVVAARGAPWELYHAVVDPAETRNLAAEHPEVVRRLAERWNEVWDEVGERARGADVPASGGVKGDRPR